MQILAQVFSLERARCVINVDSHLNSGSCDHNEEFKLLKEQLNSLVGFFSHLMLVVRLKRGDYSGLLIFPGLSPLQESQQKSVMESMMKVARTEKGPFVAFPEQEHYQEECRKLTKQIATLEQHASITEWKLKRRSKLAASFHYLLANSRMIGTAFYVIEK